LFGGIQNLSNLCFTFLPETANGTNVALISLFKFFFQSFTSIEYVNVIQFHLVSSQHLREEEARSNVSVSARQDISRLFTSLRQVLGVRRRPEGPLGRTTPETFGREEGEIRKSEFAPSGL
jgi:hypothetical protein